MKDGQGIENDIGSKDADMRPHLRDIDQQVFVAQRHPLGFALGAGSEEDDGGLFRIGPRRQKVRGHLADHGGELVHQRQVLADVFQIHDLGAGQSGDQFFQSRKFDQAVRRDHAFHQRGSQRAF